MRKQITKHFSYKEMTRTDTGLPNIPSPQAEIHLVYLCRVLERVRFKMNQNSHSHEFPLIINSAYRSKAVNEAVGGSPNSSHLDGRACDISLTGLPDDVVDKLLNALYDEFPSEIYSKSNYIHFAI